MHRWACTFRILLSAWTLYPSAVLQEAAPEAVPQPSPGVNNDEQFEVAVLTSCEVEWKSKNYRVLQDRMNLLNLTHVGL